MQKNEPPHPAQKYLNVRAKNLAFFKRVYPGIYDYFNGYEMQHSKVDILPDAGEIDILVDNCHVYRGASGDYAKREVATFLSAFDYGVKIKSIGPLEKDTYKNPRFFARSIASVYHEYYRQERVFSGYELSNFFPLMVFMGVGLGKHIDIVRQIRDIRHALLFETDMDRFAASLYAVDWQEIIQPFFQDGRRSFNFILLPGGVDEDQMQAGLWNQLIKYCPIFPVTCMFYNHSGHPVYDRIIDKVNSDLYVHLFSFGNFDDELNQLNNALHNFRSDIKLFFRPPQNLKSIPICVVGSGPSLDKRIEELRQLSKHAIVISCGSALAALHKHGVVPDLQIELESDYTTYALHCQLDDPEYLKSIKLLGAAQLNPLLFEIFGESRLFFKDDGPLAHWFANPNVSIPNATPTCTNAALALASLIGSKQVYLFGLDYGFPDLTSHHATGTVYYKENLKKHSEINEQDVIYVPAAAGGTVATTTFLYTAKRRTENLLQAMAGVQVFNCSDGASLDKTTWLASADEQQASLDVPELAKKEFIEAIFAVTHSPLPRPKTELIKKQVIVQLTAFTESLKKLANEAPATLAGYTDLCSRVGQALQVLEQQNKGLYYFTRGSIWHFLLAGYTHVFSMNSTSEQAEYLDYWTGIFVSFLTGLTGKTKGVTEKQKSIYDDDMVSRPIFWTTDADSEDIAQVEWTYTGVRVEEGRLVMELSEWQFEGYGFDGEKYVRYEDLP